MKGPQGQPKRVLVVDDDAHLAEMLQLILQRAGLETKWSATGENAVAAFRSFNPALILLDVMLPGKSGIQVCREIRAESGVPIIMLTARTDTQDVVAGLEAGADDYIVKPFKNAELLARINARLRRTSGTDVSQVTIGDLSINAQSHTVCRGGEQIDLTPLEFDLLLALARRPQQVFTREVLLEDVWGYRHAGDTRLVNVHVQRLRAKVELDPERPCIVVTVRGIGYRAGAPATDE